MSQERKIPSARGEMPSFCSICFRGYRGEGNSANPVNNGRCCDGCEHTVVLKARDNYTYFASKVLSAEGEFDKRILGYREDTMTEPEYWEAGDDCTDDVRELVDKEVRDALIEYFSTGRLMLNYRLGGSPTISFSAETVNFDPVPGAEFGRDLGDVLLAELEEFKEAGPYEMEELFAGLFEVYEKWRAKRTTTDPRCNIPIPQTIDGEPINRSETS